MQYSTSYDLGMLNRDINNIFAKYTEKFMVGFADLREILKSFKFPDEGLKDEFKQVPFAISIAVRLPDEAVDEVVGYGYASPAYCQDYLNKNKLLNEVAYSLADVLGLHGIKTKVIEASCSIEGTFDAVFPHKTAAVAAGLGWIGKNCLLVTEDFGARLRLITVLTDFPLSAAEPMTGSLCGTCNKCVEACPSKALKGINWFWNLNREDLFEPELCLENSNPEDNSEHSVVCGRCLAVCPWGRVPS